MVIVDSVDVLLMFGGVIILEVGDIELFCVLMMLFMVDLLDCVGEF